MHWGRYQPEPLPDWPTKALRNAQCYREEADRLEVAALEALGVEPRPEVEVPHEDALDLAATKLYVFTEDACECLPCGDLRTVAAFLRALADRRREREGGGGE